MLYDRRFFATLSAAERYRKKCNGVIYSGLSDSPTIGAYKTEAVLADLSMTQQQDKPFCVVWNIVSEGPIHPEELNS